MILNIRVIPNARKNRIEKEENYLKVHLVASPERGRANKLLIALLSEEFKVNKSQVRIVQGEKSRQKIVEILEER